MFLSISALQHYAYCPRQFALIHVEQTWEENRLTAEGRLLHERVDSGAREKRRKMSYERGVSVVSHTLKIQGKLDLLEIESGCPSKYFPVEYKRGKPKVEDWDRVQLCAQALCIEEMRQTSVIEGAIWYWETYRREVVNIDGELRNKTIRVIDDAMGVMEAGKTPAPIEEKKKCRACSLKEVCKPDTFLKDRSLNYIKEMFDE